MRTKISNSTGSASSLGLAYQWYITCRALHRKCTQFRKESYWTPTRLLDIGENGCLKWRLVLPAQEGLSYIRYMTLSHCWGSAEFIRLLMSNMEEFRRGRPISSLPQNFRDAIAVTRRFSIRYLWI